MNSARWTFFQLHLSLNGCQYNHSGTQWKFGHEQVLNGGELCGHWVGMCGRLNICVSVFLFKMGFNVAMMQRAKRNPLSFSFLCTSGHTSLSAVEFKLISRLANGISSGPKPSAKSSWRYHS